MSDWTVIKLGGSLLEDSVRRAKALTAIAQAWQNGSRIALVHGGGKRVDGMLSRLGIEKKTRAGLRITDGETLDVVVAVLAGLVNKLTVAELSGLGVRAVGLSGADGGLLSAELHPPADGVSFGFVGGATLGDPSLLESLVDAGCLPVIASVAISPEHQLLNVNADTAAAAIASALQAQRLLFLTDVPGLLDDKGQVIDVITADTARQLLALNAFHGGIVPKLRACVDALAGGTGEVVIAGADGHQTALLKGMGGTRLVAA